MIGVICGLRLRFTVGRRARRRVRRVGHDDVLFAGRIGSVRHDLRRSKPQRRFEPSENHVIASNASAQPLLRSKTGY